MENGPRPLQQDAAVVGAIGGSIPFIVVCDGHGSVPLLQREASDTPENYRNTLHVGGRQAAEVASQTVAQYIQKYSGDFRLHSAHEFFHAAFVRAHQVVLDQIEAGARRSDGSVMEGLSALDANFFRTPHAKWAGMTRNPQSVVTTKHLLSLGGKEGVYYHRAGGTYEHTEFGTTCTCCTILNAPDSAKPYRKVVVTAHVGDSDACLFRFSPVEHAGQKSIVQFGQWLTKEHTLYAQEERDRPIPMGGSLAETEGTGNLKFKVRVDVPMPAGTEAHVAYEPTRGLGHRRGQEHGIIAAPSISMAEVEEGDIIIVASDGLWNALGGRRRHGDTRQLDEEMEGPLLMNMRQFLNATRHKDPQPMAGDLMALAKSKGLHDNTTLAVMKISGVKPQVMRVSNVAC
mmetsp:Transcript_28627/g.44843  ORF Transcript_28627/g.44843 Transcript_28627/m.44843 type:complete len:401 (-) Transcript_28627:148-1350(-)